MTPVPSPSTVAESRSMMEASRARLFALFLDDNHVEVSASHNIRKPLTDTLERLIGNDDLFGVMTPEMSAAEVAFARKTTTIDGILSNYWHWGERSRITTFDPVEQQYHECYPGFVPPPPPFCQDDDRGVADEMIVRRRESRTLDALEDLARYLRGVREERKAVLVISDGWRLFRPNSNLARRLFCDVPTGSPLLIGPGGRPQIGQPAGQAPASHHACDPDRINLAQLDDEKRFRRIPDEANRANVSFYTIDPRGLPVWDEPLGPAPPPTPVEDADLLRGRIETLRTLADATDGLAIVNSNDLDKGFKRILDDLTSYYLLGYYSTGKLDGRFHFDHRSCEAARRAGARAARISGADPSRSGRRDDDDGGRGSERRRGRLGGGGRIARDRSGDRAAAQLRPRAAAARAGRGRLEARERGDRLMWSARSPPVKTGRTAARRT